MPLRLSRLIRICLLLPALAAPLLAQDAPTVTITPASGAVEQADFDIQISGLAAEGAYSIEILFEGEVVFSSAETSDADGELSYPISSTAGDLPGIYTLQVISGGDVVASADFELTTAVDSAAETAAERDFPGDITVTPPQAPFGKVQTIRIGELEALTNYTVEITASATLQVAYRRIHASDAEGVIEIDVFAEEGDSAGLQAIAVYDGEGEAVAAGEFTIEAPPERDATVALAPALIEAGQVADIAVTGLAAFDSVTAQITSAEGVLIDTILARASSEGEVTLSFAAADDLAAGQYAVEIFVDGDKLAAAELRVGELEALDVTVTVDPPGGDIGTQHTIAVGGLPADGAFALVILDPDGAEEYRSERSADAQGEFSLTISSAEDDAIGDYRVEIRHAERDDLLAEASFAVSAAAEPEAPVSGQPEMARVTIAPGAAPLGSSHLVRVSGLRPNETVDIDVRFAGASVYRTEKRADVDGGVRLELETDDEDETGDYTITVLRDAGNQPSARLTATARAAPEFVSTITGDAEVIAGRLRDGGAEIMFSGQAGQVMLINVASHDFDPAVALIDEDDFELVFSDDSRGQNDPLIGPFSLPYSGEYTLAISAAPLMMPQGAIDGEFVVTIAEVGLAPLAFEQAVAFSLSAEAPAQYFALPVAIGDSLTVTVDSGGALDTLLQLVAPSGLEYAFDDDSGSGFDAELSSLVFDQAATYALVVSTFEGAASGAGTVTVRRNPVQALEDGTARVTLNDKAIRDLVVFDAAEDEVLILNLRTLKGDVEDLYVKARVEGMEVMAYSTMGVPDELPLAFVMPMSGHVVVTLEKFGYDDGISLEVSLERP